jgi:hypothetical protein
MKKEAKRSKCIHCGKMCVEEKCGKSYAWHHLKTGNKCDNPMPTIEHDKTEKKEKPKKGKIWGDPVVEIA